jgi:hypothetical protein
MKKRNERGLEGPVRTFYARCRSEGGFGWYLSRLFPLHRSTPLPTPSTPTFHISIHNLVLVLPFRSHSKMSGARSRRSPLRPVSGNSPSSATLGGNQSLRPSYYMFPGTDVTQGSADGMHTIKLYPGHQWAGLVSRSGINDASAIYLTPVGDTPGTRISIPVTLDDMGETVISFVPGECLAPTAQDTTNASEPESPQRYIVTEFTRMWAKDEQSLPGGRPFSVYCRPAGERTEDQGVECLYPPADETRLRPSLYADRSANRSHRFNPWTRGPVFLTITPDSALISQIRSNRDTFLHALSGDLTSQLEILGLDTTNETATVRADSNSRSGA